MVKKFPYTLFVACGGALGSVFRAFLAQWNLVLIPTLPFVSTLFVNILGSLGIGFFYVFFKRCRVKGSTEAFIIVGFFGGFTTFSTFTLDVFHLFNTSHYFLATFYGFISVILSFIAVFIGAYVSEKIHITHRRRHEKF